MLHHCSTSASSLAIYIVTVLLAGIIAFGRLLPKVLLRLRVWKTNSGSSVSSASSVSMYWTPSSIDGTR